MGSLFLKASRSPPDWTGRDEDGRRRRQCNQRRDHEAERDEARVNDYEIRSIWQVRGPHVANISAVDYRDAPIGSEAFRELTIANVEGDYVRCTAPQQNISE